MNSRGRAMLCGFAALMAAAMAAAGVGPYIPGACGFNRFPVVCTDGSACDGTGVSLTIQHSCVCSPTGGGWDFTGTVFEYGGHWRTPPLVPRLRFWEFDRFMNANSGCEEQDRGGAEWVLNGDEWSCGIGATEMWWANLCWCGTHLDGAPIDPAPRAVLEFSQDGWFSILSVPTRGGVIDPCDVTNGTGANHSTVPMTAIPAPAAAFAGFARDGWTRIDVTVPAEPPYFGDGAVPDLILGAAILYYTGPAAPASHEPTTFTGWANLVGAHDDSAPGVIPWDRTATLEIRTPGKGEAPWLASVVVYQDRSVLAPGFTGSLTASDPVSVSLPCEYGLYRAAAAPALCPLTAAPDVGSLLTLGMEYVTQIVPGEEPGMRLPPDPTGLPPGNSCLVFYRGDCMARIVVVPGTDPVRDVRVEEY